MDSDVDDNRAATALPTNSPIMNERERERIDIYYLAIYYVLFLFAILLFTMYYLFTILLNLLFGFD